MKILLYILFLCVFSLGQADTVTVTENDPTTLVEGVSVITGDFYAQETDIVIQGVQPIRLGRNYISQKGKGYWEQFSYHLARYYRDPGTCQLELTEPTGGTFLYKGKSKKKETVFSIKEFHTRGMTNTARGSIFGKYNIKNQEIKIPSCKDKKYLYVFCADGTRRIYKKIGGDNHCQTDEIFDKNGKILSRASDLYLLEEEELPNGNKILYEWPKKCGDTWMIRSCNPNKSITYAWARFYPKYKKGRSRGDYGVETSDGRHLEYYHFSYKGIHQLKKVSGDEKPDEIIEYLTHGGRQLVNKISWPKGRTIELSYYLPGDLYKDVPIREDDELCFRIKQISAPLGENNEKVTTHTFIYDLTQKKTTVLDAYGAPTIYTWNEDLRPVMIERFHLNGPLYNKEQYVWGQNGTQDETNLLCSVLFNGNGEILHATRYFYNACGDVETQVLFGDLTGEGRQLHINQEGFPEEGCDVYTKSSTYSKDGKHLLLSHTEDNGSKVIYSYHKNTSLQEKESHYNSNELQWTRSWKYDDHNNCILEEVRDVKGHTDRSTGFILQDSKEPYAGMPVVIEEFMGKKLLTTVVLHYTRGGRIEKKDVYGAHNLCYFLNWHYNDQGCLVEEVDPLGHTTETAFDELHNAIFHRPFGKKTAITMEYDLGNRLKVITTEGEGRQLQHSYKYNRLNQKTASQDEYGSITKASYNRFGNLLEKYWPNGGVDRFTYDGSGYETSKTDARGHTIYTFRNAYGSPTRILYPDGTKESFRYYKNGSLRSHVDQNGMETLYTYDASNRVLSKQTPRTFESSTYDSFNVTSQTDAEGHTTVYTYDEGGRLVQEQLYDSVITYEYDTFSRLHTKTQGDLVTHLYYDFLDRVIKEEKRDPSGNLYQEVSYQYEFATDHKTVIQKTVNDQNSEERIEYNAFNDYRFTSDPLGHRTQYLYENVPHRITVIDPLGLRVVRTYNEQNKLQAEETYSPAGVLQHNTVYHYDQACNLLEVTSYFANTSRSTVREYDAMNRVVALHEGLDKVTRYAYTYKGLLKTTIKPSGVVLTNTYYDVDLLKSIVSSDGTINYSYQYDQNGNLISCQGNGTKITRSYDNKGNLEKETFSTGSVIENTFDSQNRRKDLILQDGSSVHYDYNALHLKRVSRIKGGALLYAHEYLKHDLSGNVLLEGLPFSLGMLRRGYDPVGRPISLDSSCFTQGDTKFDLVGNIIQTSRQRDLFTYAYDDLYHLIKEKDHTYAFDAEQNRRSKDLEFFTINALNQTSELEYNADGNPKHLNGKVLSYDALDRLTSLEEATSCIFYAYDGLQRRLAKKVYTDNICTEELYYLFDDQNEIGAFDGTGSIVELRILGDTSMAEIGSAIAFELRGETYIPSHDLFGNVSAVYSPIKNTIERYDYTAFGEELFSNASSPWRFSSKRTDRETGFVYYGRRHYHPKIGRWLTPDPLGLDAGLNLYAFVLNSPLTHFDLYGLSDEKQSSVERFYEPIKSTALTVWNDPHFQGSIQAFGGLAEASFGGWMTLSSGGVAAPLGWPVMAHGLDHFFTGMNTAITGRQLDTATSQLLQTSGLSQQTADLVDSSLSLAGGIGGAYAIRQGARTLTSTNEILSLQQGSRIAPTQSMIPQEIVKQPKFTQYNYRQHLIKQSGIDPGRGIDAHHIFPQHQRKFFESKGMNIDDPKHLAWWKKTSHQKAAYQYRKDWDGFIEHNQAATVERILQEGKRIMLKQNIPKY